MTPPEFSRPHPVRAVPVEIAIEADEAERAALADRFGLISLDRLEADIAIERARDGIAASGRIRAEAVQACVVTGDPVPADIDERFALLFLREAERPEVGDEEEIELGEDDCDTLYYTGDTIDLGEAAAQTLALALDPFPRSAGADAAARAAGVLSEGETKHDGPFAKLARLKDDDTSS